MISNVLVVCTGNICRSPMGAALLAARLAPRCRDVVVSSAGLSAVVGAPADALACEVCASHGLDLSGHVARQLTPELVAEAGLILVMTADQQRRLEALAPSARGKVQRLGRLGGYDVPDPYGRGRPAFEQAFDLIARGIHDLVPILWSAA